MSSWFGVSLLNGRVYQVTILSNNLKGTIANLNLPNLQKLYLSYNQLSGSIPNFNLPNLQYLYLGSNQLSGSIPNFNLPVLSVLGLGNNQLSSVIPNFNLPNLRELYLEQNQLTGVIPNFNLPVLSVLGLGINQLSGTIPNFNLPSLSTLNLTSNKLSDTIPNFNLPFLSFLNLGLNQLSGIIPNFNLPNLQNLYLNSNQLSGTIPNFNLPNLRDFQVNTNKFTFTGVLSPIQQGTKTSVNFNLYTPQDSIFKDTTYQNTEGSTLTINLGIDDTVTTNIYKWYKNNIFVDSIKGNNKRVFNPLRLTDAGVWTCRVTNPNAPLLTLYSRKATVVVAQLGVCWVTNTNDAGAGSLREAINCANSNVGVDTIKFNIAGNAPPFTITPLTELPAISQTTIIDATTQPNYYAGIIKLSGDSIIGTGFSKIGIELAAINCAVYGLWLDNFGVGIATNAFGNGAISDNVTIGSLTKPNYITGSTTGIFLSIIAVYGSGHIVEYNVLGEDPFGNIKANSTGIQNQSNNSTIRKNILKNNTSGISITGGPGNRIKENAFTCNDLGISLVNTNSNNQKVAPIISKAQTNYVSGMSQPNDTIEIFYSSNTGCTSKPCQGKTYLGTTIASINGNWQLNGTFINGNQVTATATDVQNNTSPFAVCAIICTPPSVNITSNTPTICNSTATTLTANVSETGLTYQWSRNGTTIAAATQATYATTQTGSYAVKATRVAGCDSTATFFLKPQILVDSGLVAYYPFDGDALDYSGNGKDGTPQNNLGYTADRQNNTSKAANFTSTNDANGSHVLLPNLVNNTTTELTVSMWVFETSMTSPGSSYFGLGTHNGGYLKGISHSSGTTGDLLYFSLNDTVSYANIISMPFPAAFLNKWKHYAMTYKNGVLSAYVDGVLLGTKTQTVFISRPDLAAIAKHWYSNGGATAARFTGKMDDIRLYNRALTAAEIQLLAKPATYNFAKCTGDSLKLTTPSVSGVSYTWKKAGTTVAATKPNATTADNATYTLDVTYKGCTFAAYDTTVVNSVKAKPIVSLGNDTAICNGSSAYLQATSGFSAYQWSAGTSTTATNVVTPSVTTPYSVTVTNTNGCKAADTTVVTVSTGANCGLIAHYKLDGNAADSSGNGNHGTAVGGVIWAKDRFGNCNGAASFDGIDDYIKVKQSISLEPTQGLTLAAWVNGTSMGGWLIRKSNAFTSGYILSLLGFGNDFQIRLANMSTGACTVAVGADVPNFRNTWVFLTGTYDLASKTAKLYVNGNLINTQTNACYLMQHSGDLFFAADTFETSHVKAYMDDIRIYNRALSVAEIQQLYTAPNDNPRTPAAAKAATTTPSVCSGSTAVLTATPVGSGVTYLWYKNDTLIPSATAATYSASQTGAYRVRVTDATGCDSLSLPITITVNPFLVPDASNDTAICQNNMARLWIKNNASNFKTYSWSTIPITTTATVNVTPSGTTQYFVTVTDVNGCSGKDSVTVTVNQNPAPIVNDTVICQNSTALLWIRNNTTNFKTYAWSTTPTPMTTANISISPSSSITYTVTVTDANGCRGTDTARITVNMLPTVSLTPTAVACFGQSTGSINLTTTGGKSPFTFVWSNGMTTQNPSNLTAGTYSVTVKDANNCTATTQSTTITQPNSPLSISSSPTITNIVCNGQNNGVINVTVTGGTPNYTYNWLSPNGFSSSSQNISSLKKGDYKLTVTDSRGCTATTTTLTITEPDPLSIGTATIGNDSCQKVKGYITIAGITGGNGSNTFSWSNGATTQNLKNIAAGAYTLTTTDSKGCKTTASFSVQNKDKTVAATINKVLCPKDSFQLPLSKIWVKTAGLYNDLTTNQYGCDSIIPYQISFHQTVNAVDDALEIPQNTKEATIDVLLNDVFPANLINVTIRQKLTVGILEEKNLGVYNVKMTRPINNPVIFSYQICHKNCPTVCDTATVKVSMKDKTILDHIETAITPNGDGKNDKLDFPEIDWLKYPGNRIEIYNRWGQPVFSAQPYNRDWEGQNQNGQDLPAGDYFIILRLSIGDGKIIVGTVYLQR